MYSDRPLDVAAARNVLDKVEAGLTRSPLGSAGRHAVFVCNAPWRRRLYFLAAPHGGALNYYPWTTNVFLAGADVEERTWPGGRYRRIGP